MSEAARILVVDDDLELRENLAEVLGGFEFEAEMAGSGEEALARLAAAEYDLVLLDLLMPGMGGMETLAAIRREHPKIHVVMLTAYATVDNAVEAMRIGAEDYIAKPFRVNELLVAVRRILEEARLRNCRTLFDMDGTFNCLANALRREIVRLIHRQRQIRFMEIARRLGVEDHTKINFHLKMLKDAGLIRQDEKKTYSLTEDGEKVIDCINHLAKSLAP